MKIVLPTTQPIRRPSEPDTNFKPIQLTFDSPPDPAVVHYVLQSLNLENVYSYRTNVRHKVPQLRVRDSERTAHGGGVFLVIDGTRHRLFHHAFVEKKIEVRGSFGAEWLETQDTDDSIPRPLLFFGNTEGRRFAEILFPVFRTAFAILTGKVEHRSLSSRNPFHKKGPIPFDETVPVLEMLGLVLKTVAQRITTDPEEAACKPLASPTKTSFFVALTHDVDVIRKDPSVRIKKGGLAGAMALRDFFSGRFRSSLKQSLFSLRLAFSRVSYATIPKILEIEGRFNTRSTFFFSVAKQARHTSLSARFCRQEPDYSLDQGDVQSFIEAILKSGGEIGLHGGVTSAPSAPKLLTEFSILKHVVPQAAPFNRFHWLEWNHFHSPGILESAKITLDSTVAFVRYPGFRTGIAHPYFLFDLQKNQPTHVLEIPLVFMDMSLLLESPFPDEDAVLQRVSRILDWVRRFNGIVALNWHPETFSTDFSLSHAYKRVLSWIAEHGGKMGTLGEAKCFHESRLR